MNSLFKYIFNIFSVLLIVGCQVAKDDSQNASIVNISEKSPFNQYASAQAVNNVLAIDEVNNAKAVNSDKTLVLVFDAHQFDRFRMKKIEKRIKNDLNKLFPDKKVEVSYDEKIMLEVERLQRKMDKNEVKKDKLKKDIKKITTLMKEKT